MKTSDALKLEKNDLVLVAKTNDDGTTHQERGEIISNDGDELIIGLIGGIRVTRNTRTGFDDLETPQG